ncbi:MAG: 30S ribosomal protein S18 [Endomicrobium sp.]|jgi:small subunit ribosomal protein S18|nr:30S ribosomal protein S18 [Endomicrobium sp.]
MKVKKKNVEVARGAVPRIKKGMYVRKKVCRICADKVKVNDKNISLLRAFVSEKGRIISGRMSGTCAKHQREIERGIKRGRMLGYLGYKEN